MAELNVRERSFHQLPITDAASLAAEQVVEQLASGPAGLSDKEAAVRLAELGPNAVRTHRANGWAVLGGSSPAPSLSCCSSRPGCPCFWAMPPTQS